MSEEKERESTDFKVSDRRKFTQVGELRPDAPTEVASPEAGSEQSSKSVRNQHAQGPATTGTGQAERGKMDFSSFLLSLATTGMVHLGEIPDPATGKKGDNLQAAQQMIDIVCLLQEKTKGNLSAEESNLLENLLYELRMKYLAKSKVVCL